MEAIVLYGPPTAGKWTVAQELHRRSPAYYAFPTIVLDDGQPILSAQRFRRVSAPQWDQLLQSDALVCHWSYIGRQQRAVDNRTLLAMFAQGLVPIVCTTSLDAVQALQTLLPAAVRLFAIHCSPAVTQQRLHDLGATVHMIDDAMLAYDGCLREMSKLPFGAILDTIDTTDQGADQVAARLDWDMHQVFRRMPSRVRV